MKLRKISKPTLFDFGMSRSNCKLLEETHSFHCHFKLAQSLKSKVNEGGVKYFLLTGELSFSHMPGLVTNGGASEPGPRLPPSPSVQTEPFQAAPGHGARGHVQESPRGQQPNLGHYLAPSAPHCHGWREAGKAPSTQPTYPDKTMAWATELQTVTSPWGGPQAERRAPT